MTDENDNAPRFQFLSPHKMTVKEDAPLGTRVCRVEALDSDVGENAVFEYAITHANIGKTNIYQIETNNLHSGGTERAFLRRVIALSYYFQARGSQRSRFTQTVKLPWGWRMVKSKPATPKPRVHTLFLTRITHQHWGDLIIKFLTSLGYLTKVIRLYIRIVHQ